MVTTLRKELSFTLKISMLFVLLGIGYYTQNNKSQISQIIENSMIDFNINNDFLVGN